MKVRTLLFLTLALAAPLRAQDGGVDSPLRDAQGVRVLGLGGTGVSWLDEPAAVWWNPATLAFAPVRRLELQHTQNAFDTRTEQFALVLPTLDYGSWALAGALQTTGDVIVTGPSSPVPLGTETFNRFRLAAGYGVPAPYGLHIGGALKVVGYRFTGVERAAWGLDLGVVPFRRGSFAGGLVIQNLLTPKFAFADGLEDVWPRRLAGGLSARLLRDRLLGAVQMELAGGQDARLRLGAEYAPAPAVALRAGFDGDAPTFGLGVAYNRFRVDYAYVTPSDLGTEHRFGLTIDLGTPVHRLRELRAARMSGEVASAVARRDESRTADLRARADSAWERGDWEAATLYLSGLRLLAPDVPLYRERLDDVARARDSLASARIAEAAQAAAGSERERVLVAAYDAQMAAGQWHAARELAENLRASGAAPARAASLSARAADSADAAAERALQRTRSALARGDAAAAAGWAQVVLLHRPGDAGATTLLRRAEFLNAVQKAQAALLAAVSAGDTTAVLSRAQDLLSLDPEDALALRYLRVFSGAAAPGAVSIADLQADEEAWGWYTRAFEELRAGRYAEAIALWERVLARYPASEDTRKNIEQARLRLDPAPDQRENE